jgi:hypothetical protein
MKKFLMAAAMIGICAAGVATAEVKLGDSSLDQVTAGTNLPVVGGAQLYTIQFSSTIVNRPNIKFNTAGAGAQADALGKNTLTEAKTYTSTVQGVGSTSSAGSLSVSAGSYHRPW